MSAEYNVVRLQVFHKEEFMTPVQERGIESIEPDDRLLDDLGLWALNMMWPIAEEFILSFEMLVHLDLRQMRRVGDEGWAEVLRCWIVDEILLPLLSFLYLLALNPLTHVHGHLLSQFS